MAGCMGAPVFRFARPNAFVQATSPLVIEDTTAPGTRYFARRSGMRSSSARAKGSSGPAAVWNETPRPSMKIHEKPTVLAAGIVVSVAARVRGMQTEAEAGGE